jgi:hypothetical protein
VSQTNRAAVAGHVSDPSSVKAEMTGGYSKQIAEAPVGRQKLWIGPRGGVKVAGPNA